MAAFWHVEGAALAYVSLKSKRTSFGSRGQAATFGRLLVELVAVDWTPKLQKQFLSAACSWRPLNVGPLAGRHCMQQERLMARLSYDAMRNLILDNITGLRDATVFTPELLTAIFWEETGF
jgi:hypothetical protein